MWQTDSTQWTVPSIVIVFYIFLHSSLCFFIPCPNTGTFLFPFLVWFSFYPQKERGWGRGLVNRRPLTTSFGPGSSLRGHSWGATHRPRAVVVTPLTSHFRSSTDVCLHPLTQNGLQWSVPSAFFQKPKSTWKQWQQDKGVNFPGQAQILKMW